jgi:hypothetical protein
MEFDYSKCDRTQGNHAQQAKLLVMKLLGVSPLVVKTLSKTVEMPATFEYKGEKQVIKAPVQTSTGNPDTTSGNVTNSVAAIVVALNRIEEVSLDALAGAISVSGMSIVGWERDDGTETFLKGWWVLGMWVPLPSAVIKLTKTLKDPAIIFKTDSQTALRMMAFNISSSLQHVPRMYPILGDLLALYDRISIETSIVYSERSIYKTDVDETTWSDNHTFRAIEMICSRYSLEVWDILSFSDCLKGIQQLPVICNHRVLRQLSTVDYYE